MFRLQVFPYFYKIFLCLSFGTLFLLLNYKFLFSCHKIVLCSISTILSDDDYDDTKNYYNFFYVFHILN